MQLRFNVLPTQHCQHFVIFVVLHGFFCFLLWSNAYDVALLFITIFELSQTHDLRYMQFLPITIEYFSSYWYVRVRSCRFPFFVFSSLLLSWVFHSICIHSSIDFFFFLSTMFSVSKECFRFLFLLFSQLIYRMDGRRLMLSVYHNVCNVTMLQYAYLS